MKQDLWRRAEEIFHAALERSPELRSEYLDQACGDDPDLRRQVEILVSTDEHAGSFLETPLLADAQTLGRRGSLVGRQCGPYRILSLLGAGGMGEVYHAQDCKLGRDVAIKTLPPAFIRDPERLARFRREARTLASLNHSNIAAIYGLEESAGIDYLVLEFVEGDTLYGPLPLLKALNHACQVAEALEAAHAHGIIHRDLKPANLKITPQGKVKVLDFGLAKPIRTSESDLSQTSAAGGATLAWKIVGTPGYMSPEQVRGAAVDQRTDIWAFGCLLFELLTGTRAFEGETAGDRIAAVLSHQPDWRALPADTPPRLRGLLQRCLQKDAGGRPSHIREVRAVLEEVQRNHDRAWLSAIVRQSRFAIPVIAMLLVLGFLGVRMYTPSPPWPRWGGQTSQSDDGPPTAPINSVAVLPFANLSRDIDNEYFGDGLAEDISNALGKLPGLRVIPPGRGFTGRDVDFSQMGKKLTVASVLEGSVRKFGSRIRVTAQLILTADRSNVWSERYDREMTDVFAIQDEISNAIVEKLRVHLGGRGTLVKRYTTNVEAYNLYLRGRYSILRLTPESLVNGKQYLEQAITLDGDYALAYAGLAEYYWANAFWGLMAGNQAVQQAKTVALAAIARDDTLAEAHAQLAVAKAMGDFDWTGAEREFQRALRLNPSSAVVHYYYGFNYLRPTGRLAEELLEARRVVDLDPLSARYNANLGYLYDATGQRGLAITQYQRAIELDPNMYMPYFLLAMAYAHMGRMDEAISAAQRACELSGRSPRTLGLLAWVYSQASRRSEARALLQELTLRSRTTYVPPSALAFGYAGLQDADAAFEWLNKGIEQRDFMIISNVKWAPVYMFLQGRPRYEALLRKMHLAE